MLIDAVKRGDGFAAKFLLDQPSCNATLTDRTSDDSALHLACTYAESTCDPTTYDEMLEVAKRLLSEHKADPNLRNQKG